MVFIIRMQYLGHHLDRNAFHMDIADINFGFSLQFRLLGASLMVCETQSPLLFIIIYMKLKCKLCRKSGLRTFETIHTLLNSISME